jgi:hypothetical protein
MGGGVMTFGVVVLTVVVIWSLLSIVASVSFGALAKNRDLIVVRAQTEDARKRRLAS